MSLDVSRPTSDRVLSKGSVGKAIRPEGLDIHERHHGVELVSPLGLEPRTP